MDCKTLRLILSIVVVQTLLGAFARAAPLSGDLVVKPSKKAPDEVGLVLIQGAQISPDKYLPLIQQIQNASKFAVWAGAPAFLTNIPEPLEIGSAINRILTAMQSVGMNKTTKIFFAAHSLGGTILQSYLYANSSIATGQILLGSFLLDKYRNGTSFPVPTMTIGGELDGLSRVTRIMEEYYFRIHLAPDPDVALAKFPVMLVRGLSHLQFASGKPPDLVRARDLKPEISQDDAHEIVAGYINDFIRVQLGDKTGLMPLVDSLHYTGVFFAPLIAAFEMEGYYRFKPPCNSNPVTSACSKGSPWSEQAQKMMGGLTNAKLNDTDAFHPVWQINPVHLPHVNSNCTAPTSACTLLTNTVTQNVYEAGLELDTGFVESSAHEMRVKLKSRQAVLIAAGHKDVYFNETDKPSLCKLINQASYNWALQNADNITAQRFQKYGVQMIMGEDEGPYNEGPLWIWKPLDYKTSKDSSGRQVLTVRSIMMKTPINYPIAAAAGMHYCKLLSPARALEWMYVDGLRKYYGINDEY